jgi:hypothetical protein
MITQAEGTKIEGRSAHCSCLPGDKYSLENSWGPRGKDYGGWLNRVHPRQTQKWVAEDEGGNLGGREDFNTELELMMENVR